MWRWSGAAVLFDMDGTLVDSEASVRRAWHWAAAELDVPFESFLPYLHGIPAEQVLRRVLPELPDEQRRRLGAELQARQSVDTEGVLALPGAAAALRALPAGRWTVVTSADRRLATARLEATGLPVPDRLVTAELTAAGKPAPDPYRYAAALLDAAPADCLVVEDSPAGVESGLAAGCRVLGVLVTHPALPGAERAVADLAAVRFAGDGTELTVQELAV